MITLLFLTYAAICVAVFRFLHLRVTTWTVASTALGGLVMVGGLLLALNYNQPFTPDARILFHTTPIFSTVKGTVIDVPVEPNRPLKKGTVLFRLDPRPFQDVVDQRKAELAQAEQHVKQLKAALDTANAKVEEAQAARDRTRQTYDRYAEANAEARHRGGPQPYSQLDEQNRRDAWLESEAAHTAARATAENARLAYDARIGGVHTIVARLQAELSYAEYELSQATVVAPTDGYVTQLFLRPGMTLMPMPIRPVLVFIHRDDRVFAASFPQNVVQRIRPLDEAEIAFEAIPGRVFKGRVRMVIDAIAQGQLQPSGDLVEPESRSRMPGRAVAVIDITDDLGAWQLPAGSTAQVAVYTQHWRELAIVRRLLLRMKSWMNYVSLEG